MNKLKTRIGIIGGGQLGKMMALEAKKMGFYVAVLDPSPECPCKTVCDKLITAAFNDRAAFSELSEICDVLTYEFEHIDAGALISLENKGRKVYPSPQSLKNIQNKLTQKMMLLEGGVPVGDFCGIESEADLKIAGDTYGYPYYLKTAVGGYDGKGNFLAPNYEKAVLQYKSFKAKGLSVYAEKLIQFDKELSVLAARGIDGEIRVYPVAENIHNRSVLYETSVPADISEPAQVRAREIASRVMQIFDGVGMFCVEMFHLENGELFVNEVAPRPHNSGHYTIEACVTSQFEQHIRAVSGLPLGSEKLLSPVVMRNILAPPDMDKPLGYEYGGIDEVMRMNGLIFHNYGKTMATSLRKLGHFTVLADTVEKARQIADEAQELLTVVKVEER